MQDLVDVATSWQTVLFVMLAFGFVPGFVLRLVVKIYPPDDPRRRELVAELYRLGWLDRLLCVGQQLETVLFEGVPHRLKTILAPPTGFVSGQRVSL